ncbi:MAG: pitrilysin family protein [Betaproteobacteria bacterium]
MNAAKLILAGVIGLALAAPSAAQDKAAATVKAKPAVAARAPAPAKPASAPAIVIMPEKVTTVEGITEYKLPNGLRILLNPDQSKPTVTVNITYLVGSRHENYGETGMAHLLEHMVFKGTKKLPNIKKDFNERGARFNGTTSLDRTNYYELLQATDDNLRWAIEMEADRMVNSLIAKTDLDSEMTVVRNEYERGENAPFGVLLKRAQSIAYDWHNYGNSTIGNRSDIENVKIENLQAFYHQYYQPDNAVLLVAGKFDEAKTLQLIGQYFGPIAKPTRVLPTLWTVEPTQDGERSFIVRRKGDIQIVALAYKVPSALHADSDAISFMNYALTDSPTGRLYKALVETGKAVQVAGIPLGGRDGSLHVIAAVVKKGEAIEPIQAELTRIVENFYKTPMSDEEMARARKTFANAAELTINNHERIGLQMSEYIALGDWRLFFIGRDRAETMTAAQVSEVAAKYYKRDNRVVGQFQPEDTPQRADLPAPPAIADVMKDFKGKQTTSVAEAFDPSNANIDARTKRIEIGGIKIALLSKKNKGETVTVTMRFHTGDEKSLFGKRSIGSMTGQMLSRGTTKFNRAQLSDEFDKLKMAGGVSGLSAGFQTTRANVVESIKLAAHVMRQPSFPESEFEQLKKQSLTGIESQKNDPGALAGVAMGKHFNAYPRGDVRYASSFEEAEEDVRAVTLQQLKDYHKTFYAATKGEIAIVGDFDEAAVTQAIREGFGDWKGGSPYTRITSPYRDVAPANRSIETPDKENATFSTRVNVDMNEDDADYPALYLANYIIGGGAGFDSRLTARIRVKDGLSYGVGSQLSVPSVDRGGAWVVGASAAPQNIAKVEAAFREELARALKDGFTDAEITAAKSGALQRRVQSRAQDGTVAAGWVSNLELGKTFAWSKQFEDRVSALTAEQVTAALRKHINPDKVTIVKAGDFVKAAKLPVTPVPAPAATK